MSESAYLLLVEDNPGDARLTQSLLSDLGEAGLPSLRWVQTADAAISMLCHDPGCTAVLLDLGLPDSAGLEALHALTGSNPQLPIIVLTGDESAPMGLDAVISGAQDFLIKGHFDAAMLQRSIAFATQRKRAEVALIERSLRDELTGLLRRSLLMDRLQSAMTASVRSGMPGAVIFIDLDQFKQVNDLHGHAAGDAVLRAVAERLLVTVRASDTVARLGGDEFVVLLPNTQNSVDAQIVSTKLLEAVQLPLDFEGQSITVGASIGVTLFAGLQESPEDLLRRADTAMYKAKATGKGRVQTL